MSAYWLGTRTGDQIEFKTRVPTDLANLILHTDPPPDHPNDDSKRPKAEQFTRTIDGKTANFHTNNLVWVKTLDEGKFTYEAKGGGAGAHWPAAVDTTSAEWPACKAAFLAMKRGYSTDWYIANPVITLADSAPTFTLNLDLTAGQLSAEQQAFIRLREWQSKTSLTSAELKEARTHILAIANAGRANTNYRKAAGCKEDVDLASNLPPLTHGRQGECRRAKSCRLLCRFPHTFP